MKKTNVVLGAIVAVGVVYVGSSWYVGKEAQRVIQEGVAQANERVVKMLGPDLNTSQIRIEIQSWDRGVFSSSARYVIHTRDTEGKPMEYVLEDHLQHGPFPLELLKAGSFTPLLAYSQTELVVTPAVQEWFDGSQDGTPLSSDTRVGFGGKGVSHWTFAPLELTRDEQRISFSGGQLKIEFSQGVNNNVATGEFGSYTLNDLATGEHIELRDISLTSTTREVSDGQYEHNSSAQVRALTFWLGDELQPVMVEGLDVALASTQHQHLLDAGIRYDATRILVEGNDLGQMAAAVSISNLDIPALTALQASYAEMAAERGADIGAPFEPTADEQRILEAQLRPVLAAGPTLSVDPLNWTNQAGSLQASASITVRDPGNVENALLPQVLRELVDKASLRLSVDRTMVVELFSQVAGGDDGERELAGEFGGRLFDEYGELLAGLGLVTLSDGTLSLSLEATPGDDRFVLNGDTLSTEQLMILMLGLMLL